MLTDTGIQVSSPRRHLQRFDVAGLYLAGVARRRQVVAIQISLLRGRSKKLLSLGLIPRAGDQKMQNRDEARQLLDVGPAETARHQGRADGTVREQFPGGRPRAVRQVLARLGTGPRHARPAAVREGISPWIGGRLLLTCPRPICLPCSDGSRTGRHCHGPPGTQQLRSGVPVRHRH